jgi:anti-sigma factor RsiW
MDNAENAERRRGVARSHQSMASAPAVMLSRRPARSVAVFLPLLLPAAANPQTPGLGAAGAVPDTHPYRLGVVTQWPGPCARLPRGTRCSGLRRAPLAAMP